MTAQKWSPWGAPPTEEFLQVPHFLPQTLHIMGFGPAEILVVFAMASEIRPGKSEVKSSQKQLAKYANCTSRTVRRALTKMQTHGMVTKIGECNTYDLRDFFDTVLKFKETLD